MLKDKTKTLEAVAAENLSLKEDTFEFNNSGLDFLVAFAEDNNGERWVLRLPRREDVLSSMKKEKKILDLVKNIIEVEVPDWEVFTDQLIAYKLLKGIPAGTIDPEKEKYIWEIDKNNLPEQFVKSLGKLD